jgi:hypothetical protein
MKLIDIVLSYKRDNRKLDKCLIDLATLALEKTPKQLVKQLDKLDRYDKAIAIKLLYKLKSHTRDYKG